MAGSAQSFDYVGQAGVVYHERRRVPPVAEEWIAGVRAAKLQPHIRETDAVFEYGVGFGWNLMRLRCARKTGFDVTPGLREIAEQRGIEFIDRLEQAPSAHFDSVICHHTLEHLEDPLTALRTIGRLLKSGGRLLLFVPYEMERKFRSYDPADKAHHLYSWTPRTLGNLVAAAGYSKMDARLQRFRFDRVAAIAAFKLKIGEAGYRFIRRAGQLLLPEYEVTVTAVRI